MIKCWVAKDPTCCKSNFHQWFPESESPSILFKSVASSTVRRQNASSRTAETTVGSILGELPSKLVSVSNEARRKENVCIEGLFYDEKTDAFLANAMNSNDLTSSRMQREDECSSSICRWITWRPFKLKLAQGRQKSWAAFNSAHIFPSYLGKGIESATLGGTELWPTFTRAQFITVAAANEANLSVLMQKAWIPLGPVNKTQPSRSDWWKFGIVPWATDKTMEAVWCLLLP